MLDMKMLTDMPESTVFARGIVMNGPGVTA